MTLKRTNLWAACATVALLAGCESTGPAASDGARLSLSFSGGTSPAASLAGQPSGPRLALLPVSDSSGHTIDIQSVQLVLRDVQLKRDHDDDCHGSDDSCERFEAGAALVTLPLSGGLVTPFADSIAPGTYDELRLKIGEPEDDNGERAAFYAAHPTWPRKATVRVAGTFDAGGGAQPFDVYLGVNAKVEHELEPPLVVDGTTDPQSVNLTLTVDVASWFRNSAGRLIDPRSITTSPSLVAAVEANVRRSFRALRDDDRDGDDDHGEHGRGRGNSGKGGGNDDRD